MLLTSIRIEENFSSLEIRSGALMVRVYLCACPPLGVGAGWPSGGGGGGTEAAGGATPGWDERAGERESVLSIRAERTHSHVSRAPACDSLRPTPH
jgi:hypothetical protein